MERILSFDAMLKSQGYNYSGDDVVENLKKALATTTSGPGGNQSGPLMLENLDGTMTEVLTQQRHLKLYQFLTKIPSAQPLYEYNKHKGFGSRRGALGFSQGGTPTGGTSSFERKNIYNKFLGVKRGVTHQLSLTGQMGGSFEDPNIRENKDGTLELLVRLERELMFGMSSIKDEKGDEVHFDGFLTDMAANHAENVIDLEGAAFGFDHLDDSAENLVTRGKLISVDDVTCFMSPHVSAGVNRQYQDRNIVRESKGEKRSATYTPGFKVPGYDSQFGTFSFDHSILFEEAEGNSPMVAAEANAPAAPGSVTPAAASEATSKLAAATYYYAVAAFNDKGEGLPAVSAGQAITAGQKCTLTIARVTGATGYRIYRGLVSDGSDAKWIGRIPQPDSGNATFVDLNGWRTVDANGKPANGITLMIEPDPADLCFAQMTPLVKFPQPWEGTTLPFLLLLYGVLVPKAKERIRIYKNCGVYTPA